MNFDDIVNNITDKLGEETTSSIGDDIANLISFQSTQQDELKKRDGEIEKLKKTNDMLVKANGSLLQQVSAYTEEKEEIEKEAESKPFDYRTLFDKNGKFKKTL